MSSSEAVDPSSNSVSNLELYSELSCDDFLALVICSKGCDIASFRVQECWQVSAAHIVPLSFVLVEFWIRMLSNRRGETLLAQVHYLRYAWGYQQ